jgi:hypothetical protein
MRQRVVIKADTRKVNIIIAMICANISGLIAGLV